MSSRDFIETLRKIGFPEVSKLTPESSEWAFENENTLPFLNWLCNSISNENVLSVQEIKEFQNLKASGNVLDGAELEEALKSTTTQDAYLTEELQSQVEEMKVSLERVKARKHMLMKRCNVLNIHHMELKNNLCQMEEVENQSAKQKKQEEAKCRSGNTQLREALEKLTQSAQELMLLYNVYPEEKGKKGDRTEKECDHFLSQLKLGTFHEQEARFSKELTSFTKKQFFAGMADLAGEREEIEYGLLDTSSPGNVSKDRTDEDTFYEDCQEFARLQRIFPKSECARINALINVKKAASALQEARSILHHLKSGVFPTVPSEISRLRHTVEQRAAASKAEASPLVSSVSEALQELGGLQGTEILTGDYDLKLRRQDYFIKSQEKVIEHLLSQRAGHEFLSMMYDLELAWHRETHSILLAARQTLEEHLHNWQQRMVELDDPDLSGKKFERQVVDTRDTSTARLFKLMGDREEDDKQLYLPTQKVLAKAKELMLRHGTAVVNERTTDDGDLNKVKQLNDCVSECESVLYQGSCTRTGMPNLTPSDIQVTMTHVTTQLTKLEGSIKAVVKEVNNKKTDLRNNVLEKKERELFALFHNNPEKLQYVVNGLADRVKAQEIQET